MKFADAQKKMIEMLKSSEFQEREDATNTVNSIDTLIQIIKGGFITQNSQEGVVSKGFNKETGNYYEIQERAYLTGFMKKKDGLEFLNRLNKNTDKVGFEVQATPGDKYTESKIIVTSSKSGKKRPLTGEFEGNTFLRTALPEATIDFLKKECHLNKNESVMFVACFDPEYARKARGKDGLYATVLKALP